MNDVLDIDLIRTFVTVADTRNFTRAADRLGRTQSAVSLQIKRLEEIVGARLFHRTNRKVQLSSEGEMLQRYAREMLRLQVETLAAFGHPASIGRVRLGVTDTSMCYLQPVLRQFADHYPLVEIEFRCDRSWHALDALESGEVDLALVTQPCGRKGGQVVRREPLVWAASKNSSAAHLDPLPLALFGPGCIYRDEAEQALTAANRKFRHAYNSASRDGLDAAVNAGLAVTMIPRSVMPANWTKLGLEGGFPKLPDIELLLFGSGAETTQVARALETTMREVLEEPEAISH